jgi:hypothetical protein
MLLLVAEEFRRLALVRGYVFQAANIGTILEPADISRN